MILIIGPLPKPINGCSYANEVFCRNLKAKNITYDTINTSTPDVSSKQGTKFSLKKAIAFLRVYVKCYKIFKATLVYTTPGQTFFGLVKYAPFYLLCILLKKKYVIHVHGNYLGKEFQRLEGFKKKFFKFLIKKSSAGIVLSKSLKANFDYLLKDDDIYVVENFVDDDLIKNYDASKKSNKELSIVYLSNLMEEKGILDLLDALILLKQKGLSFQASFAGKVEESIKDLVHRKIQKIGECASYKGLVFGEEKISLLMSSNVFILPTYYIMEGQPISILEGMAAGNIIISTKHAGIPDIMNTNNGFFVDKRSAQSIANTLYEINNNLKLNIEKFSVNNADYVSKQFTEEQFASKLLRIIDNV